MMSERNTTHKAAGQSLSRRQFLKLLGTGMICVPLATACARAEQERFAITIETIQSEPGFNPAGLTVPKGALVIWQNIAPYPQTVTCDPSKTSNPAYVNLPDGARPFDSGTIYPGQTWSYQFQTPGTYLYFSQYDQSPNLLGTITVTG